MSRRIHIVGVSSRSGTTLMMQLMVSCFAIDKFCDHERRIFYSIPRDYEIYCSKHPLDILAAGALLALDRSLWMICLVRDPRDAVVSKHQRFPDMYWGSNLGKWKRRYRIAARLAAHPRFFIVLYESLVSSPDRLQSELMNHMPFLCRRADFSQFHKVARPTSYRAERALGGVRPITTGRIGAWRSHKPRLAAQLELYGDISNELIRLGYERDSRWLEELAGIKPDNGRSYRPDRAPRAASVTDKLTGYGNIGRFAVATMKRRAMDKWRAPRSHATGQRQ